MTQDAAVPSVPHFGRFLRRLVDDLGGPTEFERLHHISEESLRRWGKAERSTDIVMRAPNRLKLAKVFGYESFESLARAADTTPMPPDENAAGFDPRSAEKFLVAAGETIPDRNVDSPPRQGARIPEWESEVAAGHWIDCISSQLDVNTHRDVIERGMFIIRVRGDSMTPAYQPGCRVLFKIVRLGDEPLIVGRDYCFQNSDGLCTLKRLKSINADELILAPLNERYRPLRLARDMLARASIVEGILFQPWDEVAQPERSGPIHGGIEAERSPTTKRRVVVRAKAKRRQSH